MSIIVGVILSLASIVILYKIARVWHLRCLKADFQGDDCRYWFRTYGQEPCANCKKKYAL